ncbi:MAG: hypothetical protein Q8R00_02620 [Candidatus Nanoarchaeia archaeon]|nr:hypothetical protein [Candidatus Nanoarchaeia archaeon]
MEIIRFKARVRKRGDVYWVPIPKQIKEKYNLKEDEKLTILKITKLD